MDDQLAIKENAVAAVFLSYFNRAPEFQAMQWYVDLFTQLLEEQGDDPAAYPNAFKALAAQIYADGVGAGEVPSGSTITDAYYVNYLYQNILGRSADAEGLAYWVAELGNGNVERAELVALLLDAAQGNERDAAYVNNRTEVALEFAKWQNSNPTVLDSLEFNAAEVLVGVNEDPASVETGLSRMFENTSQDGNYYILTPEVDLITGTLVDDMFVGTLGWVEGLGLNTLSAFDSLDGSSGYDLFDIYSDGTTAIPATATIVNIEEIHFHYMNGFAVGTVDASRFEGATSVWQIGAATDISGVGVNTIVGLSDVFVAGGSAFVPEVARELSVVVEGSGSFLGNVRSVEIDGVTYSGGGLGSNANAAINQLVDAINDAGLGIIAARTLGGTFGITLTAASGAYFEVAGAQSVDVINFGSEAVPAVAEENITVSFTGASGAIALDGIEFGPAIGDALEGAIIARGNTLASLDVTGDLGDDDEDLNLDVIAGGSVKTFTLNTEVDTFLNVTGAALTALDASGSTGDLFVHMFGNLNTVTAGSGDDVIVVGRLELTDTIDGGEGEDMVVLNNQTFQTQDYDAINQLQNIEILAFTAASVTLDASQVSDFKALVFLGQYVDDAIDDQSVTINNLQDDQIVGIAAPEDFFRDAVDFVLLNNAAADVTIEIDGNVDVVLEVGAVGDTGGTLTLGGEGYAVEFSNIDGKFAEIDASGLDAFFSLGGWVWDDIEEEWYAVEAGLAASVVETVRLNGEGVSDIVVTSEVSGPSSSVGKLDTIYGFDSEYEDDAGYEDADWVVFTNAIDDVRDVSVEGGFANLQLAWAHAASQSTGADDVVFFLYNGDTYLFADSVDGGEARYDNGDFALKIIGEHDLAYLADVNDGGLLMV